MNLWTPPPPPPPHTHTYPTHPGYTTLSNIQVQIGLSFAEVGIVKVGGGQKKIKLHFSYAKFIVHFEYQLSFLSSATVFEILAFSCTLVCQEIIKNAFLPSFYLFINFSYISISLPSSKYLFTHNLLR